MATDTSSLYVEYKPLLSSIAYRMLGSLTDAEDIVQDIFAELETMQTDHILNMKAYLLKMVTNRSINVLKSARKTREVYTGPWLPEPEMADAGQTPETAAIQAESVSYALLVLLEQLSPVERAVFILRETLDYDYRDIAELLDKSDANCRKLYSRAKQKVSTAPVPGREERAAAEPPIAVPVESTRVTSDQAKHAELLSRAFMAAANSGDFREFVGMLADDARLYTDGGGKVRSAIFPIIGSNRILAFLQGIAPGNIKPENQLLIDVNGQPGLRLNRGDELFAVLSFQFDSDSRPVRMFMVTNPDKLKHVTP